MKVHAALADPHRLRIVDLLALSDRSPSEIAHDLDIGSNLLAHHVAILEEAGLVERLPSAGDGRRRYLRLVPQVWSDPREASEPLAAGAVLFVCTANSARSQMAAALWNLQSDVPAESAGTHPAAEVHPSAVRAAARMGLDLSRARPRTIEEITIEPDLVVTVCDLAHEELEPIGGRATTLHWSIPDPRLAGGQAAFDDALARLDTRVAALGRRVTHRSRRGRRRP